MVACHSAVVAFDEQQIKARNVELGFITHVETFDNPVFMPLPSFIMRTVVQ